MDYVLLECKDKILPYASAHALNELSMLELMCLIYYLVNNGHVAEANQISALIEMKAKLTKVDKKHFKNLFDTVLSATELGNFNQPKAQDDCFG